MAGFLDLRNAKRIWHGGQEVTRLWAGGAAWAKPATAPVSIFSLATPQAGKVSINVVSVTDTSIQLDRPSTARSWISWAVNWPVGSRVVFNWSTSPSARMHSGLDDAIGLGSLNHIMSNSIGSGSVDYTIPAGGGWNYFGFRVGNGQAAGLVTISNFGVYAP